VVHIGARLARRFTLLSSEAVDVPGLERFLAHDSRLNHDVTFDVITALSPTSVRQAAGAAARVRDPRLLRILAAGRERLDEDTVTYIVTDRVDGIPLNVLLEQRLLNPRIAGAIVGDATRALAKALSGGVHHGYLRPSAIAIAKTGRVTVSGAGMDGELALQAGVGRGATESADAVALGKLYLAAITGMAADAVTERDLPKDLGVRARALCDRVIHGTGPGTLDEVLRALAPIDTRILRDFPSVVQAQTLLPRAKRARRERLGTPGAVAPLTVAPEVASRADQAVQEQWAEAHTDPNLAHKLAQLRESSVLGDAPGGKKPGLTARDESAVSATEPVSDGNHVGANDLHDLYEFEEMVDVQNVDSLPSIWEAILERLHSRWPASETITQRLERAHVRAQRAGPIKGAPVLVPLLVIVILVVAIVAFSMLKAPLDLGGDGLDAPRNTYPAFTYSPSPSPSTSATDS